MHKEKTNFKNTILTVNVDFSYNSDWNKKARHITEYDKKWNNRNIISKVLKLLMVSKNFNTIIFNHDVKLAFIFSLLHLIYLGRSKLKKIIFITLLIDISIFSYKNIHQYIFYYIFVRLQNKIIVHTSEEINIYKKAFKIGSQGKFIFIPYFYYQDNYIVKNTVKKSYIICAGNFRDIETFVKSITYLNSYSGIVIAGEGDRQRWEDHDEKLITILFNQPYNNYKKLIAEAVLLVVPIDNKKLKRSLGIIATFQAVSLDIPVIAADSFHLIDYFNNHEIQYYKSRNFKSLANTIEDVMKYPEKTQIRVHKAKKKLEKYYSNEIFLRNIENVCY